MCIVGAAFNFLLGRFCPLSATHLYIDMGNSIGSGGFKHKRNKIPRIVLKLVPTQGGR